MKLKFKFKKNGTLQQTIRQVHWKQTDSRTCVSYYQDENGLIHSSYSIIGVRPVTEEQFKKCIEKDTETKVSFVWATLRTW